MIKSPNRIFTTQEVACWRMDWSIEVGPVYETGREWGYRRGQFQRKALEKQALAGRGA